MSKRYFVQAERVETVAFAFFVTASSREEAEAIGLEMMTDGKCGDGRVIEADSTITSVRTAANGLGEVRYGS